MGGSKRDLHSLLSIAEIVLRFDVVAVQEARDNLKALRHLLKVLGPNWGLSLTDVTEGAPGNAERMAFVFDTRRVVPSGLACEIVVPEERLDTIESGALNRQFARTPYTVSIRCSLRLEQTLGDLPTIVVRQYTSACSRRPRVSVHGVGTAPALLNCGSSSATDSLDEMRRGFSGVPESRVRRSSLTLRAGPPRWSPGQWGSARR